MSGRSASALRVATLHRWPGSSFAATATGATWGPSAVTAIRTSALARWRALLAAATELPSTSATSTAGHPNTSRSTNRPLPDREPDEVGHHASSSSPLADGVDGHDEFVQKRPERLSWHSRSRSIRQREAVPAWLCVRRCRPSDEEPCGARTLRTAPLRSPAVRSNAAGPGATELQAVTRLGW